VADANKAREEKVREVSSTDDQLVTKMKGEIDQGQVTLSELKDKQAPESTVVGGHGYPGDADCRA
jgi:hypothetical protein